MKPRKPPIRKPDNKQEMKDTELIRLNKFIANSGICSRREADKMILAGAVKVNGKIITELGTKIALTDKVLIGDQALHQEKLRYILLNKPKNYITTADDPYKRNTVMALIRDACPERIYPVGRLDRNTTGLLLLTNDGIIAKKLTHPRYGIRKIYHVVLDQPLTKADLQTITGGIELDDGFIKVDRIEYVTDGKDKREVGLELHSGKNRVVRRIFEKLGYKVEKLDRVYFAGLTKKNLPRGKWRFLEEKEINMLKMISSK
ncbi:MAG: rRNA pseudouridine synthase [Bacteroidetes bacterium]|nr:MAG: rRNA pseudouridine synthase [Bacteroidota bacterium]